jgi:glycerol kinase
MEMGSFILALDQGTTSSRSILFDKGMGIIGVSQTLTPQSYPKPGWVEQDAEVIWHNQLQTAKEVIAFSKRDVAEIVSIGITNQRESVVVWDRKTGKPVYPAIIWQDRRTSSHCKELRDSGLSGMISDRTGLVIDPYFSATKIRWILNEVPGVAIRAERGELCLGTIDSWLIWKLTGGLVHATDHTNASRTLLYNIDQGTWDTELLKLFDIPESLLPEVKPSLGWIADTDASIFGKAIPICGVAGDQQAALFGQYCYEPGMAKNTYGTGCFMLMNTGAERVRSVSGLLTTICCGLQGERTYALEGSVFIAGAAVQWLRDGLGLIVSSADTEAMCVEAGSNMGVFMVPAFAGLGAPYWDADARGIFCGLTQGVGRNHIVRAVIESIAYQSRDILQAMEQDSGIALRELRVDGGASVNDFLMQFQADILGTPVIRPSQVETTALGAALLAGLSSGFWSLDDLRSGVTVDRKFDPQMSSVEREALYKAWLQAVVRART